LEDVQAIKIIFTTNYEKLDSGAFVFGAKSIDENFRGFSHDEAKLLQWSPQSATFDRLG